MARICPETKEKVIYLQCQECESKLCRRVGNKSETVSKKEEK